MNQKELTKIFMMISNWKKNLHCLYESISALSWLNTASIQFSKEMEIYKVGCGRTYIYIWDHTYANLDVEALISFPITALDLIVFVA